MNLPKHLTQVETFSIIFKCYLQSAGAQILSVVQYVNVFMHYFCLNKEAQVSQTNTSSRSSFLTWHQMWNSLYLV